MLNITRSNFTCRLHRKYSPDHSQFLRIEDNSDAEATLESFRFTYRTVGRQPLDGENDHADDPEEDPRILRRPVQWEERQNDQYWTHNPLDPIVQCDRNQFNGSSREVGQKGHE